MNVKSWLEPSRADVEAVAFRLTITNAFLFSATLITLSLNVSLVRQAFVAGGMGTAQWLLAATIVLMMFSAMILLFMGFVVLANTPLAQVNLAEILQRLDTARLFLAVSGFMLFASYGSLSSSALGLPIRGLGSSAQSPTEARLSSSSSGDTICQDSRPESCLARRKSLPSRPAFRNAIPRPVRRLTPQVPLRDLPRTTRARGQLIWEF